MAMPTSVNNQITDAVTQTKVQNPDNAPITAIAILYGAIAHALGIAVENAANNQQQIAVTAQAATNQQVMLLLSAGLPLDKASPDGEKVSALLQVPATMAAPEAIANTIEQAVTSASKPGLDQAGPWSEAVREIMHAAASGLHDLQKVMQQANTMVAKQAATTAVWINMIKDPDHLEQYQKMLALIQ